MNTRLFSISLAMAVLAAGCGGSNSSLPHASPATSPAPSPLSNDRGTAKFTITIPRAPANATSKNRNPQYVSSATQSVKIAVTQVGGVAYTGTSQIVANVTPTSNGCVAKSGTDSGTQCIIALGAIPTGSVTFAVTTYSLPLGAGNALSTNTVNGTIATHTITPVALTLNRLRKNRGFSASSSLP